ncbi:MAG: nitrous oxide reductase accessory protein NosL [Vicinamibacteria bacterium]
MKRTLAAVTLGIVAATCSSSPLAPAALDTRNEACSWCRMAISDARTAGQLVAPSEEPKFFDDIGCLGHYVAGSKTLAKGAVAYVADHRTKAWVRAVMATYTRAASLETPMASHLMAHADAASRDADPDARGGTPLTLADVFGRDGVPGGNR